MKTRPAPAADESATRGVSRRPLVLLTQYKRAVFAYQQVLFLATSPWHATH